MSLTSLSNAGAASLNSNGQSSSSSNSKDGNDEELDRIVAEEYSTWKNNCHLLYDTVITYPLEWSSPTVQWLPFDKVGFPHQLQASSSKSNKKEFVEHGLLIGTNSGVDSDYGNRLYFLGVKLPHPDAEINVKQYDQEKGEMGGYQGSLPKIEIYTIINHRGDVNRARVQSFDKNIVATRSSNGNVYIFNKTMHPSIPPEEDMKEFKPQVICSGLTGDSFALDWNPMPHNRNILVSTDEDGNIAIWNAEGTTHQMKAMDGIAPFVFLGKAHEGGAGDVQWSRAHASLFASCGNDSTIKLWDIRKDTPTNIIDKAHEGDVNCLTFSPHSEYMFASGGDNNVVKLWDKRNLSKPVHDLVNPEDGEGQIYQLSWSPHNESYLASCGSSRRTNIWDISKIGEEKSIARGHDEDGENDDKNVPPELIFSHGGHTSTVTDVSWNEEEDWTLATVASDNILQIWQVSQSLFDEEEEGEGSKNGDQNDDDDAPPKKKQATVNSSDLE